MDLSPGSERVFKTTWFAKASTKARISDDELCSAIRQVMSGQADDLGGGVFKKRLGKNLYRSLILARGKQAWIYTYLFAKQHRSNIDRDELTGFRKLAGSYTQLTDESFAKEVQSGALVEICQ